MLQLQLLEPGYGLLVSTCFEVDWVGVDDVDGDGLLFAFGVEIDSTYFSLDLVETDVIEAFKGGPNYCSNSVVWN